jgi:hypothetical protein
VQKDFCSTETRTFAPSKSAVLNYRVSGPSSASRSGRLTGAHGVVGGDVAAGKVEGRGFDPNGCVRRRRPPGVAKFKTFGVSESYGRNDSGVAPGLGAWYAGNRRRLPEGYV